MEQDIANATFGISDEISCRDQNTWTATAKNGVKTFLKKNCLQLDNLFVYEKTPMRFTRNMQDIHVTQSQLCVMKSIPNIDSDGIKVLVVPPCVHKLMSLKSNGIRIYTTAG